MIWLIHLVNSLLLCNIVLTSIEGMCATCLHVCIACKKSAVSAGLIGWIIPTSVLPAARVSPSVVGHADRSVQFRSVIKLFACLQSGLGEMQMNPKNLKLRNLAGERSEGKKDNIFQDKTAQNNCLWWCSASRHAGIYLKKGWEFPHSSSPSLFHLYCCS